MRNSETHLRQENSATQISGVRALNSVALGVGETYNNAAKDLADSLRQLCLKFALQVWNFCFARFIDRRNLDDDLEYSQKSANTKEVKYSTTPTFSYRNVKSLS